MTVAEFLQLIGWTREQLNSWAWQNLACRDCKRPEGRRCVEGKQFVSPHPMRIADAMLYLRGQLSRDDAFEVLQLQVTELSAKNEALTKQLEAQLKEAQRVLDLLESERSADVSEDAAYEQRLALLGTQIGGLNTQIATLKAQLAEATKPPVVVPVGETAPVGFPRLVRQFKLDRDEGWVKETGKPDNADGVDRPSNVKFGQGPDGTACDLWITREGSTVYTCDAKAQFQAVPTIHAVRWTVQALGPFQMGIWPGLWERPLVGSVGEQDHYEGMPANGVHVPPWPVHAGTLHTEYGSTHKQLQRKLVDILSDQKKHVLEYQLAVGVARWFVDGVKVAEITKAQFDAATSPGKWDEIYGQASKNWYVRMTQQAGGVGGGVIPASFTQWGLRIHALSVWAT